MRALLSLCLLALVLGDLACNKSDPPVRRYHARGVVTETALDGDELSVAVHHEAIANFEGRDGQRSAMDSMTMLFGVAHSVGRDVFRQGAKIAFDFDVRWNERPSLLIVKASPLPDDTQLVLRESHH